MRPKRGRVTKSTSSPNSVPKPGRQSHRLASSCLPLEGADALLQLDALGAKVVPQPLLFVEVGLSRVELAVQHSHLPLLGLRARNKRGRKKNDQLNPTQPKLIQPITQNNTNTTLPSPAQPNPTQGDRRRFHPVARWWQPSARGEGMTRATI